MRLLYARVGRTFCRNCGREVIRETAEVVARRLGELPDGTRLLIGFDMPVVDRRRQPRDSRAGGRRSDSRAKKAPTDAGAAAGSAAISSTRSRRRSRRCDERDSAGC